MKTKQKSTKVWPPHHVSVRYVALPGKNLMFERVGGDERGLSPERLYITNTRSEDYRRRGIFKAMETPKGVPSRFSCLRPRNELGVLQGDWIINGKKTLFFIRFSSDWSGFELVYFPGWNCYPTLFSKLLKSI